ncbi:UDP-glycosyltransferase UGT5-like [Periplaneta americana]|uniref:UDP-glycosyltransferase UGT5-like n=1 Tax=Periplaneta americana TaxID=6978 RepID=UPI0037E87A36
MKAYHVFLKLVFCFTSANAAGILGLFPVPSFSHQVVYRGLMKQLHSRGHHVTVVTTDPFRNSNLENYTQIDTSELYITKRKIFNFAEHKDYDTYQRKFVSHLSTATEHMCEVTYKNKQLQKILLEHSFDLVIVEWYAIPCLYGYSYFLSTPLVGICSTGTFYPGHEAVANPTSLAYVPDVYVPHNDHKTFWERLSSVWHYMWFRWLWYGKVLPRHDAIARKYFGDSMPYIGDIAKNVSLVMLSHDSLSLYMRPNVPVVVEVRELHLEQNESLPQDVQEFLDGAAEGVIYLSLGSNVLSDEMLAEKRQMFLDAFSELPQFKVLWKWESDKLPGKPNNVKVAKWLPQQHVLSHPNIKLFMYQGGLQSTEEALHASVPVVAIPFFADQNKIVRNMAEFGAAVYVEFNDLSKEIILEAINEAMYNKTYKENRKKLLDRLRDQPNNPLDRAVWWVEYVIRHRGARHLRSGALDLTWFQYFLLDVIAFVIVVPFLTIWITYRVILFFKCKIVFSKIMSPGSVTNTSQDKDGGRAASSEPPYMLLCVATPLQRAATSASQALQV